MVDCNLIIITGSYWLYFKPKLSITSPKCTADYSGWYNSSKINPIIDESPCHSRVLYLRKRVLTLRNRFGTKSLAIHVKACEKKWENEQNLKPPKERRPCPQAPKGFGNLVSKDSITKEEINAFNGKSYDTFVEDALIGC